MIKASVGLITYNHAHTIREALDSVLAQRTSFPFEIVVGDDASTDATPEILAGYLAQHPGRFRLRLGATNAGMVANFLGTFNDCAGQYVAILEGDDCFTSPLRLQLQVDAMDANPSATLCGTNAFVQDERCPERSHVHPGHDSAYLAGAEAILHSNFFSTCTMMVRRDGALEIPATLLPVWGDWALKLFFALRGDTLFLPQQTARYRMSGTGAWASLSPAEMESEVLRVLRAFEAHVGPMYADVLVPRIRRQLHAVEMARRRAGDAHRAATATEALAALPWTVSAATARASRRPPAHFTVPA